MNKQDAMQKLNELRARADALEKIINTPDKPEFEVGMFGKFWDDDKRLIYSYLESINNGSRWPFKAKGSEWCWQYFQPITEAILPPWIEHDGGDMPKRLCRRDIVEIGYKEDERKWLDGIKKAEYPLWEKVARYRIIKKAES